MNIRYATSDDTSDILVGDLGKMPYVPHPSLGFLEKNGNCQKLLSMQVIAIAKAADREPLNQLETEALVSLERQVKSDPFFMA